MQSEAKDVSAYLEEVPENRKEALAELRRLCREILVGYEEVMDYGMPGYKKNGVGEVGFASQKNYISLYILKEPVVKANLELLKGLSFGKGCIRYSTPKKLNFDVIAKLLEETVRSDSTPC